MFGHGRNERTEKYRSKFTVSLLKGFGPRCAADSQPHTCCSTMKAQCAVIVPDGVAAGGSFVVDLFDGSQIKVTVPAGKQPGDVIIIGAAHKEAGSTISVAPQHVIEAAALNGQGQISRITTLNLVVPDNVPEDNHLYVGSPFGGVYMCHLPAGVKSGQRISVQVPVYAEDENPDASSEEPRKLAKKSESSLSLLLDRLDDDLGMIDLDLLLDRLEDDMALIDEEIQRYFVAGLEEVAGSTKAIMCDEGGGEQQHVVVGKLVRHRTDKWLRLNREKSAFFDRHVAIDDTAALKDRPGRQHKRRGRLGDLTSKAWKSLRSLRARSRKPHQPVQV